MFSDFHYRNELHKYFYFILFYFILFYLFIFYITAGVYYPYNGMNLDNIIISNHHSNIKLHIFFLHYSTIKAAKFFGYDFRY